jgi:PAS domain S-box-containing protein
LPAADPCWPSQAAFVRIWPEGNVNSSTDNRLAEEQRRILTAIEAAPDAIWISDAQRRIVMVNAALERLTGRRREELLGHHCRALLGAYTNAGDPLCETVCPLMRLTDARGGVEACLPTAAGGEVWVEISYGRIFGREGQLEGLVHILHDLTHHKEIERLKDEIVAMVSHELRTPLQHIKGFVTTLLQTDVTWDAPTQRDFLASIDREADRLARLIDSLLHLSRLEAGRLPMHMRFCSAAKLLEGALERVAGELEGRPLHVDLPTDLPPLYADEHEIEMVLTNLLENAAKYSAPGTPIGAAVQRQGEQIVWTVADRGIGIAPEHHERIFERFYRVADQERRAPGAGLGLAICQRIVEAHGGRIWVARRPGGGSQFSFSVPLPAQQGARDEETTRSGG